MSLQLVDATTFLRSLTRKLTIDTDIRAELKRMHDKGRQLSVKLSNAFAIEGSEILRQKYLVETATSPQAVNTDDIHDAITAARTVLEAIRYDVFCLQTGSHGTIESCRERRMCHERDIVIKKAALQSIPNQIDDINNRIQTAMKEATELDELAVKLENRADDLRRAAEKKKESGWLSLFVGVLLAVPTFGASLAVGGIVAAVNFDNADSCQKGASASSKDAAKRRKTAKDLRIQKQTLKSKKSGLKTKIEYLRSRADELTEAAAALANVTSYLLLSLEDFDNILKALEDTDLDLKDIQLQNDSFSIIKTALTGTKFPKKLEAKAQERLDALKKKWMCLEKTLIRHGALAPARKQRRLKADRISPTFGQTCLIIGCSILAYILTLYFG